METQDPTAAPLAEKQEADDIKRLMAEPWGRRIARGVLEHAGVFRLSFTRDAAETAFNEGGRNGGLRLLALIQTHAPDQCIPMMQEKNLD